MIPECPAKARSSRCQSEIKSLKAEKYTHHAGEEWRRPRRATNPVASSDGLSVDAEVRPLEQRPRKATIKTLSRSEPREGAREKRPLSTNRLKALRAQTGERTSKVRVGSDFVNAPGPAQAATNTIKCSGGPVPGWAEELQAVDTLRGEASRGFVLHGKRARTPRSPTLGISFGRSSELHHHIFFEKKDIVIFFFFPIHVRRVVGSREARQDEGADALLARARPPDKCSPRLERLPLFPFTNNVPASDRCTAEMLGPTAMRVSCSPRTIDCRW